MVAVVHRLGFELLDLQGMTLAYCRYTSDVCETYNDVSSIGTVVLLPFVKNIVELYYLHC